MKAYRSPPDCQTNLSIILRTLSLLFRHFMNKAAHHWAVVVAQLVERSLPIPEVRIQSSTKIYLY